MGWLFVAGFVIWLLSRCGKKKVGSIKDELSGNTVGSLFLLDNLVDHQDRDEDNGSGDRDSEDDYHEEEWFDDDDL